MAKRTEMALTVPIKLLLEMSPYMAMLFAPFWCTHPPPPVPPFCWNRTYLQRTCRKWHHEAESLIMLIGTMGLRKF